MVPNIPNFYRTVKREIGRPRSDTATHRPLNCERYAPMRPTTTPTTTQVPRVQRGWCRRSFVVSIEAEPFVVDYSPWGMNTETVSVDGVTVVRRRGGHTMSHAFHFPLGDHRAILSIALPW